jgi:hypothetical protein
VNNTRECPHEFYCWYRINGRCCHSCIEDIPNCKGCEPSAFYVQLMNQNHQSAEKQASEKDRSSQRLFPLYVQGTVAR